MAEQDIPLPTITAMKIPIIRKGEYDIWRMRMCQYICHTDHNLWDVIVNGDLKEEPAPTTRETSAPPAPKTAKQLVPRRKVRKEVYEDELRKRSSGFRNAASQNFAFLILLKIQSVLMKVSSSGRDFGVSNSTSWWADVDCQSKEVHSEDMRIWTSKSEESRKNILWVTMAGTIYLTSESSLQRTGGSSGLVGYDWMQ
ncbi:hypothetical protein Tco_0991676 [Tanacetum coccineum]|uniref:Uncharacterized protein n=1 Tax=Tanacetum coccineum TaxID=301880 RepID=A0ABQ5F1N0_9ASTR